jgi:hypothetical protein
MQNFSCDTIVCKNPLRGLNSMALNHPGIKLISFSDNNTTYILTIENGKNQAFHHSLSLRDDFEHVDFCYEVFQDKFGKYRLPKFADFIVGIKTPQNQPYSLQTQYGDPCLEMGIFNPIPKNPIPIREIGLSPLEVVFDNNESNQPILVIFRHYNNEVYKKKYEDDCIYFYNSKFDRFGTRNGKYYREYDE